MRRSSRLAERAAAQAAAAQESSPESSAAGHEALGGSDSSGDYELTAPAPKRMRPTPEATQRTPEELNELREKAHQIAHMLTETYAEAAFPLAAVPGLDPANDFQHLCAALLTATADDEQVRSACESLFSSIATPAALSELKVKAIRDLIQPLGQAVRKSGDLKLLSQTLIAQHNSIVPRDMVALMQLPGVGRKTAGVALMSMQNAPPVLPVDSHVFRLAHRWGLSQGKSEEQVEADLKLLWPETALWKDLHCRLHSCGREICKGRPHEPQQCAFCQRFAVTPYTGAHRRKGKAMSPLPADDPQWNTFYNDYE